MLLVNIFYIFKHTISYWNSAKFWEHENSLFFFNVEPQNFKTFIFMFAMFIFI